MSATNVTASPTMKTPQELRSEADAVVRGIATRMEKERQELDAAITAASTKLEEERKKETDLAATATEQEKSAASAAVTAAASTVQRTAEQALTRAKSIERRLSPATINFARAFTLTGGELRPALLDVMTAEMSPTHQTSRVNYVKTTQLTKSSETIRRFKSMATDGSVDFSINAMQMATASLKSSISISEDTTDKSTDTQSTELFKEEFLDSDVYLPESPPVNPHFVQAVTNAVNDTDKPVEKLADVLKLYGHVYPSHVTTGCAIIVTTHHDDSLDEETTKKLKALTASGEIGGGAAQITAALKAAYSRTSKKEEERFFTASNESYSMQIIGGDRMALLSDGIAAWRKKGNDGVHPQAVRYAGFRPTLGLLEHGLRQQIAALVNPVAKLYPPSVILVDTVPPRALSLSEDGKGVIRVVVRPDSHGILFCIENHPALPRDAFRIRAERGTTPVLYMTLEVATNEVILAPDTAVFDVDQPWKAYEAAHATQLWGFRPVSTEPPYVDIYPWANPTKELSFSKRSQTLFSCKQSLFAFNLGVNLRDHALLNTVNADVDMQEQAADHSSKQGQRG